MSVVPVPCSNGVGLGALFVSYSLVVMDLPLLHPFPAVRESSLGGSAGPSGARGDPPKGPRAGPDHLGVPGGSRHSRRRPCRALVGASCGFGGMVEGPQFIRVDIGLW